MTGARLAMLMLGAAALPLASRAELKSYPGAIPAGLLSMHPNGKLAGDVRLRLAIGLPLRNQEALSEFLSQVYQPGSPLYHHYLTPDEFADKFGPTENDYANLIRFAASNHFEIAGMHPNRMLLDVFAASSDVEQAFHVHMQTFHDAVEDRDFYAPDVDPSADSSLLITDISGLSNYRGPRPLVRNLRESGVSPRGGSGSGGTYFGADFRAAYAPDVKWTGSGQVIGLVEFNGFYPVDITNYETAANLPNVPLQTVLLDGYNGTPTPGTNDENEEVSLDIELALAMAPGVSQIIVYETGPDGAPNDILNRMATDNSARQLGCSWAWTGGPNGTTDQIFQEMAAQGQTFLCASGDDDAYPAGSIDAPSQPNTPSDNPYITIVGGTTLTTTGPGGSWTSEKVWNAGGGSGSGGGVSSHYPLPAWQQGIQASQSGASPTYRNIPDVALVADNIQVNYANGHTGTAYGTSCAAALWAGFAALINQQAQSNGFPAVGFLNPSLYAISLSTNYASAFHDITVGNNTSANSPTAYYAVPGYDLCTGLGTPNGSNFINALMTPQDPLVISPGSGFVSSGLIGGPFNVKSQTLVLSNSTNISISWTAGTSVSWLAVSPQSGTLTTNSPTANITASLTSIAPTLAAGNYNAVLWCTNLQTGDVQGREFTLQVDAELVQNGGFETGGFSDWTESGSTIYMTVTTIPAYVHSGTYGTQLGPSGSLSYLSQTIPTTAGQPYLLQFYLDNPQEGTPNELQVAWNGQVICDQTNLPQLAWTNFAFVVQGSNLSSTMQFGFRNDVGYFGFDDVRVVPLTAPTLRILGNAEGPVQLSWNSYSNLVYQVQFSTDLSASNWINLGSRQTATNSVTKFTDSPPSSPEKFYRTILIPIGSGN